MVVCGSYRDGECAVKHSCSLHFGATTSVAVRPAHATSRARRCPTSKLNLLCAHPRSRTLDVGGHLVVAAHGLTTSTPSALKSATLRVATIRPCSAAVAAIRLSRQGLVTGTCSSAQRSAIRSSTPRMRPANGARPGQALCLDPRAGWRPAASTSAIRSSIAAAGSAAAEHHVAGAGSHGRSGRHRGRR